MTKDQTPPNVPEELLEDPQTALAQANLSVEFAQGWYGPELSHDEILKILRSEEGTPGWPNSIMIVFHPSFLEHLKNLRMDVFSPWDPTDAERITRARRLLKEIGDAIALRPLEKRRGHPRPPAYERARATRKRNDSERFARLLEKTARLVERYEKGEGGRTVSHRTPLAEAFASFQDLLSQELAKAFEVRAAPFLKQVQDYPLREAGPDIRTPLDLLRSQVAHGLALLYTPRRRGPRRFKTIAQLWNPGREKLLPERPRLRSPQK